MPACRRSPLTLALAWLATLVVAFLGVGFVFHTDFDADVFGKYRTGYFVFLLAWWLLLVPATFFVARWVFSSTRIELPSGRVLTWRPSAKILLALALVWLVGEGIAWRMDEEMAVATPMRSDAFHPYLQNTPIPGNAELGVNRWGFRGRDIEKAKPEGTTRVVLFGGSTLFCAALPLEETPGGVLQARLEAMRPGQRFEVQNAAAEWHATPHSLIKLETWVQDFDPDVVVVYHAINDLYRSFSPHAFADGKYRADYGHFHGAVARLVRPDEVTPELFRMQMGYWFSDLLCERVRVRGPRGEGVKGNRILFFPKAEPVEIDTWASLPAFERNLQDFVAVARAKGMRVLVGSQPSLYRDDLTAAEEEVIWFPRAHQESGRRASFASMAAGMRRYNETSRRVAERTGVPFVDLDAAVPKDLDHLYDDVHTTAAGARLVGEALADALLEHGLLGAE